MTGLFVELGQALLALALAPALVGLVRLFKARLQSRRGAPFWQPYLELRKLFAKEVVVSNNASWLFRAVPYVVFVSTAAVTLLVPLVAVPLPFDGVGDLLVVVYLLLLGHLLPRARRPRPGLAVRRHGVQPRDDGGRAGRADDRRRDLRARVRRRLQQPRADRAAASSSRPAPCSRPATAWRSRRCSS